VSINQFSVIIYFVFWLVRIRGCWRRGRQPLLRGAGWFFDIPVPSDFYAQAGGIILRRYWMRMLIPFAFDIPLAVAIFVYHRLSLLNALIVGACVMIHLNHLCSVWLAKRRAQAFAIPSSEQPVVAVVALMTPRRLRDYTEPKVECALALGSLAGLAWLASSYIGAPEYKNLYLVFRIPLLLLYLQLGMLFVKLLIVKWRTPIPAINATRRIEARESTRRHYLLMCDWYRSTVLAVMLFWAARWSLPVSALEHMVTIWLIVSIIVGVVASVWIEIRRKQLVALSLQVLPVKVPDLLRESEITSWPVCYEPSAPMLMVRGARGLSLNLANSLSYVGVAYLLGLIAFVAALRFGP
jgi:hypothetical protein